MTSCLNAEVQEVSNMSQVEVLLIDSTCMFCLDAVGTMLKFLNYYDAALVINHAEFMIQYSCQL